MNFPSLVLLLLHHLVGADALKTPISSDLYTLFVRYTKYAAASYAATCPTPPNNASVVQYFSEKSTDTQATLFRSDVDREFVLAFRGTSNLQDFASDFAQQLVPLNRTGTTCDSCRVHRGARDGWYVSNDHAQTATDLIVEDKYVKC